MTKNLHELVLELTDECPLSCIHCSSNSGPSRRTKLKSIIATRLVDEARLLGAEKISFSGGEPICSPSLIPILLHAQSLNMSSEIFTCGVSADKGKHRPLSRELLSSIRDIDKTKLIFSLHGPSENIHEFITRVPNSFDCLTASLDMAVMLGIQCEINYVPLKPNADHFREILEYAIEHGVKRISVLRFVAQGRGLINRKKLQMTGKEEMSFLECIVKHKGKNGVLIRMGSPFNGTVAGDQIPCRAGQSKFVVQADGNVIPCEVFKHRDRSMWGISVYKNTIQEALSSPKIMRLRERIDHRNCMECPIHWQQLQRTLGATDERTTKKVPEHSVHAGSKGRGPIIIRS